MRKKIVIEGEARTLDANALLPRQYRKEFGRDVIVDMKKLLGGIQLTADALKRARKDPDGLAAELLADPEALDELDVSVVENLAWLMLRAGGEDVGDSVEDWLASLQDFMTIYNIMPEIVDLWLSSQKTTARVKKK